MTSTRITIRFPDDLLRDLDEIVSEHDLDRTKAILMAVRSHWHLVDQNSPEALKAENIRLKAQIAAIKKDTVG